MSDIAQVERTYDALTDRFGPVGRTLSRLIRPTFVAPEGKVFVWADWSAIEARVCPWLADTPGANEVVDIFRVNDADPSSPDIYMMDAGDILHKDPSEVSKKERNAYGKVSRLSLAYLGGKGALFGMARNYGASFTEDEAQDIIDKWRAKNKWAMDFGYDMWDAAMWCMANPGDAREVGRITFYYNPDYLHGTLFMVLPDGTWLSYPSIRWEERERKDKTTGKVETKTQLTYRSGRARLSIWAGVFSNNSSQGCAACLLRHALVTIDRDALYEVILSTHDELLICVDEAEGPAAATYLVEVMSTPPEWAPGLPLAVEATIESWYTKISG